MTRHLSHSQDVVRYIPFCEMVPEYPPEGPEEHSNRMRKEQVQTLFGLSHLILVPRTPIWLRSQFSDTQFSR